MNRVQHELSGGLQCLKKVITLATSLAFATMIFLIQSKIQNSAENVIGLFLCVSIIMLSIISPYAFLLVIFATHSLLPRIADNLSIMPGVINFNLYGAINISIIFLGMRIIYSARKNCACFFSKVPNAVIYPFIFFIAFSVVSVIRSPELETSIRYLIRFTSYMMIYLCVMSEGTTIKKINSLWLAIMVSAVVPVILGFYQYATKTTHEYYGEITNRILGSFVHPVPFGYYLMLIIIIVIVNVIYSNKKDDKILSYCIYLIALLAAIILTYTRGAWLGLIAALIVMSFAHKQIIPFLLVGIIIIYSLPEVVARVQNTTSDEGNSWYWRLNAWQNVLPLLNSSFLITGKGIGTFISITEQLSNVTKKYGAHNEYLRLLIETGVGGLFAYLWLMFSTIKHTRFLYLSSHNQIDKKYCLAAITVCIALLIVNTGDNLLEYITIQLHFWAVVAIAQASYNINEKSEINDTNYSSRHYIQQTQSHACN